MAQENTNTQGIFCPCTDGAVMEVYNQEQLRRAAGVKGKKQNWLLEWQLGQGLLRMLLNNVASGSFQKLENRGQKLQGDFLANVTKYFFCELFNTPSSQDTLTHGRFSIMLTNEGLKRNRMVMARHTLPVHLPHPHKSWGSSRGRLRYLRLNTNAVQHFEFYPFSNPVEAKPGGVCQI